MDLVAALYSDEGEALTGMVQLLHTAVNITEALPSVAEASGSADTKDALKGSMRLKLCRAKDQSELKEFPDQMVMIDPLAPIQVRLLVHAC